MKKISIIALMLSAFFTTSCENDATLEETRVADISAPSVTMNVSVNQYDATFDITLSSLGEPATREYGVMYSTESQPTVDNSVFLAAEDVSTNNTSITVSLMPGTTYYACAYALTANQIATSEVKTFTTEKAPEFSAEMLNNRVYTGTVASYFGDTYNFEVTTVVDAEDSNKIWFQNLDPYFVANGFTADKGVNSFYGILDVENKMITLPIGQEIGYKDVALYAFNTEDPDTATGYTDLQIQTDELGNILIFKQAWGMNSSGGWYNLFYGMTLNAK